MTHKICPHCDKPIILQPSAAERARKSGETPQYYRDLFPAHASCEVEARSRASEELMQRIAQESASA